MTRLLIRKSGNLIDISPDGRSPLPELARKVLEPSLSYVYTKKLFGWQKEQGNKSLEFETRNLFRYDSRERLVCGKGFFNKVSRLLQGAGYSLVVMDKNPEHPRPNRYQKNWKLVDETVEYRNGQRECLATICDLDCCVVAAPTGFGKGMLIVMLCLLFPKAKIHIVLPGRDLVSKTVRLLSKYLPNIGQLGCGANNMSRVTVISADSLHKSPADADILIGDEAHILLAPSYSSELARYRNSRNIAFTATPTGRGDNTDAKMESLFGEIAYSLTYQEAVDMGLVVPIRVEWIDLFGESPAPDKTDVAKKRWCLWRNDIRNAAFASHISKYLDDQVLVLVNTIEHAVYLRQHLPTFQLCYDKLKEADRRFYVKNGLMSKLDSSMTAIRREQMRIDFESGKLKHVIATGVWATGVSFDSLPVLVWAAGGSSEIKSTQVPGRVCRIHEASAKKVGILVDCCDQFDHETGSQSDRRCTFYRRHNWQQVYPDGRRTRRKKIQY